MDLHRRPKDPTVAWLAEHEWWGTLRREELERVAALGERVDLGPGRLLMHRGQLGIEAAVIIEGEVVVSRGGEVLALLGPGEVVGELAVLDGVPRTADVRTATDVELLVFRDVDFTAALDTIEPLRQRVLTLAGRHRGGGDDEV